MNKFKRTELKNSAHILSLLGQPTRLRIALAIGQYEACVCHLEACLGIRQATISQHLMALRDAGLVTANREGKNIYYRLARPDILFIIQQASSLAGSNVDDMKDLSRQKLENCPCPHCNPGRMSCAQMEVNA